jgi:hypothetical protein
MFQIGRQFGVVQLSAAMERSHKHTTLLLRTKNRHNLLLFVWMYCTVALRFSARRQRALGVVHLTVLQQPALRSFN